jgi:hypothetical protein
MEKNPDTIKNRMVPSYEMLEEILWWREDP